MELTTNFRSGLCAGFLYQLMSMAVGWCWDKSSWIIQTQVSGDVALWSTDMFSSSPWWPCTVTRSWDPRPPHGASSPFILARCVAFTMWLSDTERFGCSASSLQTRHALKLRTLGCASRALAVSFEWWHRAEFRQISMKPGSISRYLSSARQIRRCIFCKAENCQEGNL